MKETIQLNDVHSKVINEAYLVYEALATLETVDMDQEREAKHQLIEYVQNIKALATTAHLRGLQEVCTITEQQWLELEIRDANHRPVLYEEIERWPRLISNYLYTPTDEDHANKLITYLQNTPWQQPLSAQHAQHLFLTLIKDTSTTSLKDSVSNPQATLEALAVDEIHDEGTSKIELESPEATIISYAEDKIITTDQATAESHQPANEDMVASWVGPQEEEEYFDELDEPSTPSQTIAPDFQQQSLTGENYQDFSAFELETGDLKDDYELLPLNTPTSWSDAELDKILDETVFETLSLVETPEDPLEGLPGTESEEHLGDESLENPEEDNTEESSLVTDLFLADDAQALSADLDVTPTNHVPTSLSGASEGEPSTRPTTEIQHSKSLTGLSNRVVELSDLLSVTLNQWVTAEEDSEIFLEAIERYTNTIYSLWEAAGKLNLRGFQEVCTFVNDNVFEASALPSAKKLEIRDLFAHWPKMLLDYLQSATKGATLLIEHLSAPAWPLSLPSHQANGLLVQLVQDAVMPQLTEIERETPTLPNKIIKAEQPRGPQHKDRSTEQTSEIKPGVPSSLAAPKTNSQEVPPAPPFAEEETALDRLPVTMPDWGQAFIDENVLLASDQHEENLLWVPEWQAEATSMAHHKDVIASPGKKEIELSTNYQADSQLLPSTEENEVGVWTPDTRRQTSTAEMQTNSIPFPPLEDDLLSALGADESEDELLPELFEEMFEDQQTLSTLGEDYLLAEETTTFKELTKEATPATQRPSSDTETLGAAVELAEDDTSLFRDDTTTTSGSAVLPQDFHLASPHVIDLLKVEISEAQRDLSKALNKFAVAEDDSAEMLEAIEQYNDNVQSIAEAAKKTGLKGLQDVCTFVNENMFELSTHARIIRRTAQSHLDTWPRLVLTYLQSPLTGAQNLVAHLRNPVWPYALDEAHSRLILALLTRGVLGIEEDTPLPVSDEPPTTVTREQEQVPETPRPFGKRRDHQLERAVPEDKLLTKKPALKQIATTKEKVTPSEPPTATVAKPIMVDNQIAPDISNLLIEQLTDIEENLSVALASIYHADEGSEELLTSVATYTENVQALWEAAEMAKLGELQEVCTFINENVMALSGQDKTTRIASQSVLATWLPTVIAYLRQPQQEITKLVSHLQDTRWPAPLSVAQTATLQQHLPASAPPAAITADLDSQAKISLANPEILEVVIGQIVDLEDSLLETLNSLCEAADGSDELLTLASTYTDHVQAIWDAAEMAKLEGLQEVCTFINDNVMALGGQDKSARRLAQDLFAAWPQLTLAYLRKPAQATATLLQHLQNAQWPTPLDDTQAEALHQHLLPSLLSVLFQEAPDSSTGVAPLPPQEEATPAIILASPDVLELVSGQLVDLEEPLLETLNSLCEAADGSEDLLTVASTYTEHVQSLWEAAEMAGLGGLQEVCTFINDNVMALGGQDKPARRVAYKLFATWPQLTLAYLRKPAQEALTLLQHLQSAKWPTPLDDTQAATLQQHLLPRQTPASSKLEVMPSPEKSTLYLAAPDILELVRSQIIECQEGMSAALEVCMSMENGNPAFLEAIENYTNQVQAIWEAADLAGLTGLQEVCTFINENLMAFGTQEPSAKRVAQPYLEKWPAVVLAYLQSPLPGAQSLVQMMQESAWPTPLEADRANQFLTLLTQSSSSPEQVAAYESEMAETQSAAVEADEEAEVATAPEAIGMEVTQEISLGSAEVLSILTEELQSAKEPLAIELQRFTTLANSEAAFTEAAENYAEQVQRLNTAAEMLGLQGLQHVCAFIVDNVKLLSQQDQAARTKAKKVLEAWPDLVLAYLNSPMTSVISMLNHLRESTWAKPLPDEQAHELLSLLTQGSTGEDTIDQEPAYSRPTQAQPEDVSLKIPSDINRDLLDAYLQEVPQNASEFSELIQSIIRDPQQIGVIEHAKRIAHTLKGSSNIIGIKGLATISHHLEDTLEYIAQHKVVPPKELTDTMVEAADCIELMVDALLGQDEAPPQAQQVLQSVLDWANRIDRGNLQAPPASSRPAPAAAPPKGDAKAAKKPDTEEKKAEGAPAAGEATAGTPEQVLRVPTKTVDNLMRLVGELSISLGQIQEKMKHVLQSTRTLTEQDLILQRKTFALENLVDVRGVTGVMSANYSQANDDEDGFDPLEFEEYNELHSVAHSFIESIADNRELAMSIRNDLTVLETMFIHQQRLNKEFEASVMTTRMVPVNTILAKLQRNVRQTCRMTGKQAELELSGTDILIDSDVLNSLGDPLQHVLRNAIDHGIESADERVLLGKPASGHIHLSFYREGNNVVVKCQDDGQGLNYTNIRYTALQRGLLKDGQEVSEAELARFILMSGFSTKSGVTQVSGRGVGMDVVHTNIRQMKGTLDLASQTGKGMILLIKLPMTLVTLHVLLVRIGHRTFGIPTNNLEQVLAPGVGEYQRVGGEITFKMGKHFYPIKSLALLLHEPGDRAAVEEEDPRPVILVREETGVMTVVVDELLDTHDLVMKSMGEFVKHIHGVAGAAILGDGSVVPLLDLPELLRSPMQSVMSSMMTERPEGGTGILVPSGVPNIMIVDDSLSVRKSLSLLVEDAGFETMLAKDGLEAIELMNQKRPNVMLVDMEMPRMNGLELTAHVRANQATQNLPIFMITSRTTEKHREQAKTAGVNAYLTKPYQDTELLGLIDKALAGQV